MPKQATDAATYERARRLANRAMLTVAMQIRRIEAKEPEDHLWPRRLADYEFLIAALWRLRLAAKLAACVPELEPRLAIAIKEFDDGLPGLRAMRNVAQHIDDYARDKGNNKSIGRKSLEVAIIGPTGLDWMGFSLKPTDAARVGAALFAAMESGRDLLSEKACRSRHSDGRAN